MTADWARQLPATTPRRASRVLRNRAATGAAGAGCAAEAVAPGDDRARPQLRGVEVAYVRRTPVGVACVQREHLVEVAVVDAPVPANGKRVAAHEAGDRGRIVGV